MALSIEDKKKIVSDVNELANNASSLVLADARGLKVSEANELRSQGHKSNVKFRVAKNTLVKLGLKGTNYEGIDEYLDGPTMLAFSYEEPGAAAKILKSFAKKNENLNSFIAELQRLRPASSKGIYIKDIYLSTSMGPGYKIDVSQF